MINRLQVMHKKEDTVPIMYYHFAWWHDLLLSRTKDYYCEVCVRSCDEISGCDIHAMVDATLAPHFLYKDKMGNWEKETFSPADLKNQCVTVWTWNNEKIWKKRVPGNITFSGQQNLVKMHILQLIHINWFYGKGSIKTYTNLVQSNTSVTSCNYLFSCYTYHKGLQNCQWE